MRPRLPRSLGVTSLFVLLTACANGVGTTTVPNETTPSSVTTSSTPVTTNLEPTTTIAPDATPPELRGIWATELNADETLRLRLDGNGYQANIQGTSDTGTGRISIEGDTIVFSSSDRCANDPGGTYTWVIEDETLTFTLVGEDPCGRISFLDGSSYTLISPSP